LIITTKWLIRPFTLYLEEQNEEPAHKPFLVCFYTRLKINPFGFSKNAGTSAPQRTAHTWQRNQTVYK